MRWFISLGESRSIWKRISERDQRTRALEQIGFGATLKKCPFPHDVGLQSKRSVSQRQDDYFCTWCLHGYRETEEGTQGLYPAALEEIGNILFPPPTGFRIVDEGWGIAAP